MSLDLLLQKNTYSYDLPKELIAQYPLKDRSKSRLMVVDRAKKIIKHKHFEDVTEYLYPNDVLVINTTKVFPARLFGKKETGGKVEVLLLTPVNKTDYTCLIKPASKIKIGSKILFEEGLSAELINFDSDGLRVVRFNCEKNLIKTIQKIGEMPLPPYITRETNNEDKETYQTVYAKHNGSCAAPTAGLHFTQKMLEQIKNNKVIIAEVVLHVGLGTFRPVESDDITKHKMHTEYCEVPEETAKLINIAKNNKQNIVSVGTTTTRALESFSVDNQILNVTGATFVNSGKKETDIFIYPGQKFKVIDSQITNFHFPESTLLMMICAFAGYDLTMQAYSEAIKAKYRFYSYGDAMYIY